MALLVGVDAAATKSAVAAAHAEADSVMAPAALALERGLARRVAVLEAFRALAGSSSLLRGDPTTRPTVAGLLSSAAGIERVVLDRSGTTAWSAGHAGSRLGSEDEASARRVMPNSETLADGPVVVAPLRLSDGTRGLMLAERMPTADGGIVYLIADVDSLARDVSATLKDGTWEVSLAGGQGLRVWGFAITSEADPVRHAIAAPGSTWTLSMAPMAGWESRTPSRLATRLIGVVLIALIALATAWLTAILHRLSTEAMSQTAAREHDTLRHQEGLRQLDLALGAARMGIWEWNVHNDRVRCSPEVGPMLELPIRATEMPVASFLTYAHADDQSTVADQLAEAGRPGGRLGLTFRAIGKGGAERWLRLEGAALENANGGPLRVLAVMADVTDRMRLEGQLQQAAKMDAVGALAAGIAHDFGNMLMAIQASVQLAAAAARTITGEGADHVRTDLADAEKALLHARMLTQQLMAYSRREPPRPRPVELNEAVREMEPLLKRLLGTRHLLEVSLASEPITVMMDPNQVQQVMLNLVVNARDVLTDGGKIGIITAPDEFGARLVVWDSGPGIPLDVIPRLFDAFFTTKSSGKGTGLGLATVHRIVSSAGGTIQASNRSVGGATFTVQLPRLAAPALVAAPPAA
jgi:signal transduction histidine kinase